MLRKTFVDHVVDAMHITGRELPGPIPGVTEEQLIAGLRRNPSRERNNER
jgi:hypothetical protein